jgi:uncharacterized membrane protein
MGFAETMDAIATGVEVLGVLTLVLGLAAALVRAGLALVGGQGANEGYRMVRTVFGRSILLGLEFLVAADIIRTVAVQPSHGHVRNVGGGHRRGQRQPAPLTDELERGPRLATIDRICAYVVPRAWRARWPSHRWRATSPAGPARRAGRGCRGGAGRTRPRWPIRSAAARRSRADQPDSPHVYNGSSPLPPTTATTPRN